MRANEIIEPLAFTVCKLELPRKAIVLQSHSRRTQFNPGQLWAKQNIAMSFARTKPTKEQVLQRGFKEAHILAVVNKVQNKRKKNILPQNKNKPRRKCCSVV